MTEIEDADDFRAALETLLADARAADVPEDAITGLLTIYLARKRDLVRLPLEMRPAEAREFVEAMEDQIGETMEVEMEITEEAIADLHLQLRAFDDE